MNTDHHNNGRTKMVAQSPAALKYKYYNFGLSQSEGFRPFPKGGTGTHPPGEY